MKVIKNYLYNLSYQILTLILPLITVPYISTVLGAKGVGDYSYTYANTQYFVIFGMIGITLYGNRQIAYVRDNKEKLKNTFYSVYLLQLITISISLTLFVIFAMLNKAETRVLYFIQGLNIIAAMVDISWLFMGLEEFKKTVIRNTIVKLVSLASIFMFVKSSNDLKIYVFILGISAVVGNLTFWLYIPKAIGFKGINIEKLNIHLKASCALFIPQIAIQIYSLLDRTLLGIITDTVQVGYYENSQKLIKMALMVVTAIGTVMMPKIANTIANGEDEKVKYYIENSFLIVSFMAMPLCFGVMGIAPEMATWFFGENFIGIDKLIVLGSLIIIPIAWSTITGIQTLIPLKRNKEFTLSVTLGAAINFMLNIVFIKYFKAMGAAFATVIAEIVVTTTQLYFIRDIIKPIVLVKKTIVFLCSSLIMYVITRVIGYYMGDGITTTITQVIIGAVSYLGLVVLLFRIYYESIYNDSMEFVKTKILKI